MMRSTPSWSGSGNMTPASIRIVVSPHDSAIMFMPNSPRPPSGTTSSVDGDTSGTADWFIQSPARDTTSSDAARPFTVRELLFSPVIRTLAGPDHRAVSGGWDHLQLWKAQRLRGKTIAQLV